MIAMMIMIVRIYYDGLKKIIIFRHAEFVIPHKLIQGISNPQNILA